MVTVEIGNEFLTVNTTAGHMADNTTRGTRFHQTTSYQMSHYYTLIQVEGEELVEKAKYTNGKKAAKIASRLSKKTGRKYQVRKIDESLGDANWRAREMARLNSGEYRKLHHILAMISPADHFAHVAKKDPNLIAYTKDELKGREDKQSIATIDAYVEAIAKSKHFKDFLTVQAAYHDRDPDYMRQHIYNDEWLAAIKTAHRDYAMQFAQTVKFAGPVTNPDDEDEVRRVAAEIERVYTFFRGDAVSSSCMHYSPDEERYAARLDGERVHPVIAYASPDLAVAYLTNSRGETTARCLCWPQEKVYGRMYADNDALHRLLKELDYVKCDQYYRNGLGKSLTGARVRRIENDRGGYIMPYIDGGDHDLGFHPTDDRFFTLYNGSISGESTSGVIDAHEGTSCEHCGDDMDEDTAETVYLNSNRSNSEQWCSYCVENRAIYCHGYDVYFDGERVDMGEVDGESYSQRWIDNHLGNDVGYCDRTDTYTFDELIEVVVDEFGNTQHWREGELSYATKIGDKWYSTDDLSTTEVITERWVQRVVPPRWGYRGDEYGRWVSALAYYKDVKVDYPDFLIENGEVDVYTGVDGNTYLRDYVDHYPVDRPRVQEDGDVVESWAHIYLLNGWTQRQTDHVRGKQEVEMLQIILDEERIRAAHEVRSIPDVVNV